MVEEKRTRLPEQDPDQVREVLAFEAAISHLLAPAVPYELLTDNDARGRIGTRVENNPRLNLQDIAGTLIDYQGSLGGGTPQNPLRIGKKSTAR